MMPLPTRHVQLRRQLHGELYQELHNQLSRQRGSTLLEVLVTMVVLAFGLLGIAVFQVKAQAGASEAYQRAQAIVLLEDIHARINGNAQHASDYVLDYPLGSGDAVTTDCSALAPGTALDLCQWSHALKGAAESKAGASVGAMAGARGCITQIQSSDPAGGVCRPAIYLVSVAWQGLHKTRSSSIACGRNLYGDDGNRRVISLRIAVGLPSCS
jgi:type IV pilus assembly protein PilV